MVLHVGTKRVIIKIIFGPLVKGSDRVKELAVRKLGREEHKISCGQDP
jgi:hypothetical protein